MQLEFFYQKLLILTGIVVTFLFGVFLYREIYPEYKIYQEDYSALEEFRSTYHHEPPPTFKIGIKQIVLEREDKGPPVIDRCTSCHVALQIPYFSPTKIAYDLNGNILRNEEGNPLQVPNPDYIWAKLDEKIEELKDQKVIEQLKIEGEWDQINKRLEQAANYESLKVAQVGDHTYDVTKVLSMHPLIGKETRPFEYHLVEEYGCTSCHNGNGRGLTTDKAHGPVFDELYEAEFRGYVPQFTEKDPENDPLFSKVFNAKPGHALLFQTQPIFVDHLIQAKCMQCHQTTDMQLETATLSAEEVSSKKDKQMKILADAYLSEIQTVLTLLSLQKQIEQKGYTTTVNQLEQKEKDFSLSSQELEQVSSQLAFLKKAKNSQETKAKENALTLITQNLIQFIGSETLVQQLQEDYQADVKGIENFLKKHQQDEDAKGSIFIKMEILEYQRDLLKHAEENEISFKTALSDQEVISSLKTDVDDLTRNYQRGKELYLSQACYACHRIAGFARGGVGPDLTRIGESYPWFIKESIVWPQADLKTSTMPNMRLDHLELEDLMTFLLAQKGSNKAMAQRSYQAMIQSWEAGRKLPWEKPISAAKIFDLNYSMTVFAIEGCASCHRLKGFESNIGFKVEKQPHTFDELYGEQQWFQKLFPEVIRIGQFDQDLNGSRIVETIEKNAKEIDEKIVSDVRSNSILEEIDRKHPQAIESLYSNFRYAARAKDHFYQTLTKEEKDPEKRAVIQSEYEKWKDRVHRVLMMFIQQYGLGRLIGPRPNWSGIFRTDEWLMEHFRNPTAHVPRSIMPVFPFDDTKFYALTHMLDVLGIKNRNTSREVWEQKGFNPAIAFDRHCAQCHGLSSEGNGIVSEWIYPIPKNLHNPEFLRNLTKERAINSIIHGVKGTPMPPWGEVAGDKTDEIQKEIGNRPVLTKQEVQYLVNWIFSSLPGGRIIKESKDVLKWDYTPEDLIRELKEEGGQLEVLPQNENEQLRASLFFTGRGYYASLNPPIDSSQEKVEEIFDILPNPIEGPDQSLYYIKKKYYTPYNIEEGQKFFLLNCAVCHGNEGDGSGNRGSAMQDAKPRMFTNLDWSTSRDDLRLLRSIKYGVPGTAMTPWGDLTNALQRVQLVIFIRSLTQEQRRRDNLNTVLYQTYDEAFFLVDRARINESLAIENQSQKEKELEQKKERMQNLFETGSISSQDVLDAYQQQLEAQQKLMRLQSVDRLLVDLKASIKREKEIYQVLGLTLISKGVDDEILNKYFELVSTNEGRYQYSQGGLSIRLENEEKLRSIRDQIVHDLDGKLQQLQKERTLLEGRIMTPQLQEDLAMNQNERTSYERIKKKIMSDTEEAIRLARQQEEMLRRSEFERSE